MGMKLTCRRWRDPASERVVEVSGTESAYQAPDKYVAAHVAIGGVGDVAFVEARDGDRWILWRVECVAFGEGGVPRVFLTAQTSIDDAVAEFRKCGKPVPNEVGLA